VAAEPAARDRRGKGSKGRRSCGMEEEEELVARKI
jgi:hypothetical protein